MPKTGLPARQQCFHLSAGTRICSLRRSSIPLLWHPLQYTAVQQFVSDELCRAGLRHMHM